MRLGERLKPTYAEHSWVREYPEGQQIIDLHREVTGGAALIIHQAKRRTLELQALWSKQSQTPTKILSTPLQQRPTRRTFLEKTGICVAGTAGIITVYSAGDIISGSIQGFRVEAEVSRTLPLPPPDQINHARSQVENYHQRITRQEVRDAVENGKETLVLNPPQQLREAYAILDREDDHYRARKRALESRGIDYLESMKRIVFSAVAILFGSSLFVVGEERSKAASRNIKKPLSTHAQNSVPNST